MAVFFLLPSVQPASAQGTQTGCFAGKYCCGIGNYANTCGWVIFRANRSVTEFDVCDDQAGTVNCRELIGGANPACPPKGSACTGALSCSTQTPGNVVQQCADGACGAEETVKQQCNPYACQAGKCATPGGQIIVSPNPKATDFFEPDFTSIAIQGAFFVLTLAIIFSVIH